MWSLKGEELTTVATLQSPNTAAAVSPCGKFVACAGLVLVYMMYVLYLV